MTLGWAKIAQRDSGTGNSRAAKEDAAKVVGEKAKDAAKVAKPKVVVAGRKASGVSDRRSRPSHVMRKLAAYPRQNRLAVALRESGRVERTLFLLDWLADRDLQRRVQIGFNKGEAHHVLIYSSAT